MTGSPDPSNGAEKILDVMIEGCQIIDPQFRYLYINPVAAAHAQKSPAELLDRTMGEVFPGIEKTEMFTCLRDAMTTRKRLHLRNRFGYPQGGERWFDLSFVPHPLGLLILSVDITAYKEAQDRLTRDLIDMRRVQREQSRLEALLVKIAEASPGALYSYRLDSQGRVSLPFTSRGWEEIHGLAREEVAEDASAVFDRIHPEDLETVRGAIAASARTMTPWHLQYRYQHPRRGQIWLAGSSTPEREADGSITWHGFVIDVSAQKRDEEEIRRLNAELEKRVADRTSQIEKVNRELEAVNRELEAFTTSVSHDLRAPLRAVEGFSRILIDDGEELAPADRQRFLTQIHENALRMDKLIQSLLSLARAARSEMEVSPVDMTALAHATWLDLITGDGAGGFEFTVDPLPPAQGDPVLLRQVWANLLANAIKYTRPKTHRKIEVHGSRHGRRNVYSVRDNGVGFDSTRAEKLFGVFARLHRDDEFEGTGVGLAIVQRIVRRHGGDVRAEGAPDEGATFTFWLPV